MGFVLHASTSADDRPSGATRGSRNGESNNGKEPRFEANLRSTRESIARRPTPQAFFALRREEQRKILPYI